MQAFFLALAAIIFYGALHSLLAASVIKLIALNIVGKRVYLGLYRLFFNIVATISFFPILGLVVIEPGETLWQVDSGWRFVLFSVQVLGLMGLMVSLLQIDSMRFLGISQAVAWLTGQKLPLPDEPLTQHGVYALVRHPLYLFSLMVIWPIAPMTAAWLGFNVGVTLYFVIGSRLEEQKLRQAFGEVYEIYRSRVPWLIPFVRIG